MRKTLHAPILLLALVPFPLAAQSIVTVSPQQCVWRAGDDPAWAALAGEMRAARIVQQVLIPEAMPSVPGFAIESVYEPAGEVGGDFFQIIPTDSGGVLIVIGDVSGKGMPAALTVSLLVGTVRTLAHYTQSPGEILSAMNTRMMGRSQGGFTTCLILHARPDGTVTIANAGHLAPYVNGEEMKTENGLPLGLATDTDYAESRFTLAPGSTLTLLTDGVLESRDARGELFGFERTTAISTQSAESIAHAAQAFGQEDDITVLTLTLAPAEVLHA
jgi:serine phosphatase RsbU (regulator of sigma subunit)